MKEASVLEKKILNDLKILSPEKKIEVADFIEYLKIRKENWKRRFKSFLKKVEPKMKNATYSGINKEIAGIRSK